MKNFQNKYLLGVAVLVIANIIGGSAAFVSKVLLGYFPPVTVLFLRITIMLIVLLPLSRGRASIILHSWRKILLLGLFWIGNLLFFILGIGYTTVIASSIIYLGIPILVLVIDVIINKSSLLLWQGVGILFGFLGAMVVITQSVGTTAGFGTPHGNLLLLVAIISYSFYLTYSHRLKIHLSPLELTTGAACIGWFVVFFVMLIADGTGGLVRLLTLPIHGWITLLYIGVFLGFGMYLFNQWGIKHTSAVIAGTMLYIGTITAWMTGVVFLSEQITLPILLGAALLVAGVFFCSIMPMTTLKR